MLANISASAGMRPTNLAFNSDITKMLRLCGTARLSINDPFRQGDQSEETGPSLPQTARTGKGLRPVAPASNRAAVLTHFGTQLSATANGRKTAHLFGGYPCLGARSHRIGQAC